MRKIITGIILIYISLFMLFYFVSFDIVNRSISNRIKKDLNIQEDLKFYFNLFYFRFYTPQIVKFEKDGFEIKFKDLRINPIFKTISFNDLDINYKEDRKIEFNDIIILDYIGSVFKKIKYSLFVKNGKFKDLNFKSLDVYVEKEPKIIIISKIQNIDFRANIVFEKSNNSEDNFILKNIETESYAFKINYKRSSSGSNSFVLNISTINIKNILELMNIKTEGFDFPLYLDIQISEENKKKTGSGNLKLGNVDSNNIKIDLSTNEDRLNLFLTSASVVDLSQKEKQALLDTDEDKKIFKLGQNNITLLDFRNLINYLTKKYNIKFQFDVESIKTNNNLLKDISFNLESEKDKYTIKNFNLILNENSIFHIKDNDFIFELKGKEEIKNKMSNCCNLIKIDSISKIKGRGTLKTDLSNLGIKDTDIYINEEESAIKILDLSNHNIDINLSKMSLYKIINFQNLIGFEVLSNKQEANQLTSILQKIDKNYEDFKLNINVDESYLDIDAFIDNVKINIHNTKNKTFEVKLNSKNELFTGDLYFKINKDFNKIIPEGLIDFIISGENLNLKSLIKYKNILNFYNFPLLDGISGNVKGSIKTLNKDNKIQNLAIAGKIEEEVIDLNIKNQDNTIFIDSKLTTAENGILKINYGASFSEIDLKDLNLCPFWNHYITNGSVAFNGEFSSSGYSVKDIISNLSASGSFIITNLGNKNFDIVSLGYAMLYRNKIDMNQMLKSNKGVISKINGQYTVTKGIFNIKMNFVQELVSGNSDINIDLNNSEVTGDGKIILGTRNRTTGERINLDSNFSIRGSCDLNSDFSKYKFDDKKIVDFIETLNKR